MIIRAMLVSGLAVIAAPDGAATAQERSFACEYGNGDLDIINERASNFGMSQILAIYRDRYDAAYARAQCEAFANGEPYDISCRDGKRNWDAIEETIPDDYYGMSVSQLTKFVMSERREKRDMPEALSYCEEVGAIN